jgi:hypothetical protein
MRGGGVISFSSKGDFKNTDAFLKKMSRGDIFKSLDRYGSEGTSALAHATPMDTGETAGSWSHEVLIKNQTYSIIWSNGNIVDGIPVAILIQVGHGTRGGGYISGRDFINPALRPIFDRILNEVWREVTAA